MWISVLELRRFRWVGMSWSAALGDDIDDDDDYYSGLLHIFNAAAPLMPQMFHWAKNQPQCQNLKPILTNSARSLCLFHVHIPGWREAHRALILLFSPCCLCLELAGAAETETPTLLWLWCSQGGSQLFSQSDLAARCFFSTKDQPTAPCPSWTIMSIFIGIINH